MNPIVERNHSEVHWLLACLALGLLFTFPTASRAIAPVNTYACQAAGFSVGRFGGSIAEACSAVAALFNVQFCGVLDNFGNNGTWLLGPPCSAPAYGGTWQGSFPVCPANSRILVSGGSCVCLTGYLESGSVCVPESTFAGGSPKNNGRACEGNPCDPGTGIKTQREVVYAARGANALGLDLLYNSRLVGDPLQAWEGAFGKNWVGSYERRVNAFDNGKVTARRPDGREWLYRPPAFGTIYLADVDIADVLNRLVDGTNNTVGWTLTAADGDRVERYDVTGKLLSIADRNGITQTLVP